nr:hypothetical protein [Nitrosomonas nitrosa]
MTQNEPNDLPPHGAQPRTRVGADEIADAAPTGQLTPCDASGLIPNEGPPALGSPTSRIWHIAGDRGLGHRKAKLEKLAVYPRCAPEEIVSGHAGNQIANLARDPGTPPAPAPA